MILARKGVDHPGLSSEHALQYCLPSTVAVVAGFQAVPISAVTLEFFL